MTRPRCANPACRKPVPEYRTTHRDLQHVTADAFCCRACSEAVLQPGKTDRPHGEKTQ